MSAPPADLYRILGVASSATDTEVRHAYRELARLHHPDHNAGSAESTRRFAMIQDAYTRVLELRRTAAPRPESSATNPSSDLEARIAAMERELRDARKVQATARRNAARAASEQASALGAAKASPEDLGYVTTDDSLGRILDDAREQLDRRWSKSEGRSFVERLTDLFADDE